MPNLLAWPAGARYTEAMRIALCQVNTAVGDFEGNVRRVRAAAEQALAGQASLAVFPELTLTGYPPRDLLDRPAFWDLSRGAVAELAATLPSDLSLLVGFVDCDESGPEPVLYNAAALIENRRVNQVFHKRLLPRYDVFDEPRYFTPGARPLTFVHRGVRVGVTICEDGWNNAQTLLRRHYAENPVRACMEEGAALIVNLSASPFTLSKHKARGAMFAEVAYANRVPLAVVNLVGATDELIFDGCSSLFGPDGGLRAQAKRFAEDVLCCEVDGPPGRIEAHALDPAGAALDALTLGLRDYARKCGFGKALLGLSGGIDSALVAAIAASALGPQRVLALAMPTRYSSKGSLRDARSVAEALGIEHEVVDIDPIFACYLDHLGPVLERLGPANPLDTTFENMQARIRGNTLMSISNRLGHLLLSTGNKSEVAVGYCTLYGDMAGGLAVISDLPKTFVYAVSREFNRRAGSAVIPESVLTKAPSAELRPDQADQDTLPPYEVLDAILERLVEQGLSQDRIVAQGHDPQLVAKIAHLVRVNEYKRRQMPPGLIITSKAFGPGRRIPIAQTYGY